MLTRSFFLTITRRATLVGCLTAGLWDRALRGPGESPVVAGLFLLASAGLGGYAALVVSRRLIGSRSRSEWLCAAGVIGLWLAQGLFHLLASLEAFTRGWGLTAWATLAIAAGLWGDRDRTTLSRAISTLRLAAFLLARLACSRRALLFWIPVLLITAHTLRALATPPLNWDALTYHLVKAGGWVQSATTAFPAAPDAWSYYAHFPGGGEVLSAWAMLPFHGDLLVNLVNLPLLALAWVAFTALGGTLGTGRTRAWLGATVLILVPSIFFELRTVLVDVGYLAEVLCGLVFTLRARVTGRAADAMLAAAALGVALATKSAALPVVAALLVVSFRRIVRLRLAAVGLLLVIAVPATPWYLEAWHAGGTPLYPLPVRLAGQTISRGSPAFEHLLEGANDRLDQLLEDSPPTRQRYRQIFGAPFTSVWRHRLGLFGVHPTTPGPLILLALLLAPLGALSVWRRQLRAPLAILLLVAAATVAAYLAPDLRGMRFWWIAVTGRFLAPVLAIVVLLACAGPGPSTRMGRLLEVMLALVSLSSCWANIPLDWLDLARQRPAELGAGLALTAAAGGAAFALCRLLIRARARPRTVLLIGAASMAMLVALPPLASYRASHRYQAYGTRRDQDSTWYRVAIPAWIACDEPGIPHRIACSAGYDGVGHNWFWYPLLGSRLQNEVTYVPITPEGHILDYAQHDDVDQLASRQAWLRRLVQSGIDRLVTFPPPPIEARWAQTSPDLFTPIVQARGTRVWLFDRTAALESIEPTAEESGR